MWRILLMTLLIAGCAPLPPSPEDVQAKRFEAVPGKAVIYVVRTPMDSQEAGGLALDDHAQITMLGGTYYRWEVAPGIHRVHGVGPSNVAVTLTTEAGKVYFLQHTVIGTVRSGPQNYSLRQIGEQDGRTLVAKAELIR